MMAMPPETAEVFEFCLNEHKRAETVSAQGTELALMAEAGSQFVKARMGLSA